MTKRKPVKMDAAYWKKQFDTMSIACASVAKDGQQLRDDLAIALRAVLLGARYEKALREIRALLADRQTFVMMGMRSFVVVEGIVSEALNTESAATKSSITPEVAAQMAKAAQKGPEEPPGGLQASGPTGHKRRP
jgi:hypothetical protein